METFTAEERARLTPHFTNLDGPVFALVNLPEVVKGALFARYSRSGKSLRRLFLDEFAEPSEIPAATPSIGTTRADRLYERVLDDYGDDSVAQLGGVHLACEGASNILTKVLEWGRLMAYLEQSTRYVPYSDRPDGRFRYHVPTELTRHPLRARYVDTLDRAFETYARWLEPMCLYWAARFPAPHGEGDAAHRAAIRARALDSLRGLLPAAARSNVGIFGTAQSYEALLLRMRAHPLREVQDYAELMLVELRKVIPAFLHRLERPDRGGVWSRYLAETGEQTAATAARLLAGIAPEPRPDVTLTEFDPGGEIKVIAAALYAVSGLPDDQLVAIARALGDDERRQVLTAYVGQRQNRRHKPGRAFERTRYRFDVLADYGAFRDLQRHRLCTLEWQPLSPRHGYVTPPEIEDAGALADWTRVMDDSAALCDQLVTAGLALVAPYAIAMAYRVRFYMDMNAREAMHVIELRTSPQGHPAYRRICQAMLRLIDQEARHHAIAAAMSHADLSGGAAGRLDAERRAAERRRVRPTAADALIFDMDGVLVDSEPLALEAMRAVMARHGVAYTDRVNDEFVGRTTIETCRTLRARHALEPGEAELARQYVDAMLALIRDRPRPQPGVPDVLRALRAEGHRLALASSAEPELIRAHTEALGITDLFEVAVSALEVPRGKPAPDVFLETARRLGVSPARCLVVEDSRNGLLAAKAAGMACAVVPCATTRHQDFREADHRLDTLSGLIDVLKR